MSVARETERQPKPPGMGEQLQSGMDAMSLSDWLTVVNIILTVLYFGREIQKELRDRRDNYQGKHRK